MRDFGALLAAALALVQGTANAGDVYTNGNWYDGNKFVERTVYVLNGRLSFTAPDQIDNTYDLAGTFVIPPFAEAHNHDLTTDFNPQERIAEYLRDGVFYEGIFDSKDEMAGIGYIEVENRAELLRKWPDLVQQKPDFVKVMLSHSEEYDLRKDDPEFFGFRGIDPQLMPDLVELAHAEDLSVSAHVETAADFHYAVAAGVDEIAHLPGTDQREIIRSKDAELAAENDVAVVTTISLTTKIQDDLPRDYDTLMQQYTGNLQRLKDAGVRILVGSDMPYRDTSVGEAFLLHQLGIFTNQELLNMWCETTPRRIFPERNIGRLDEAFEASFLVLSGNPIEDFEQVRNIVLRVKQGHQLILDSQPRS